MKDLTDRTWGSLKGSQKEQLLKLAMPVSGIDSNPISNGKCIIDFKDYDFSIAGEVFNDEIVIKDDAIFYNPTL